MITGDVNIVMGNGWMAHLKAGPVGFPDGLDGQGRKEREGSTLASFFPLSSRQVVLLLAEVRAALGGGELALDVRLLDSGAPRTGAWTSESGVRRMSLTGMDVHLMM